MVLKPQGNVKKKNKAGEMQVGFNLYSAQQLKNEERMIRQLKDDDNDNDDGNVDVNGKIML